MPEAPYNLDIDSHKSGKCARVKSELSGDGWPANFTCVCTAQRLG
jgi:hypothetical protein